MLWDAKEPTCPLSVCQTYRKRTHSSPIHSLVLFLPSFPQFFCLSISFCPAHEKCGPLLLLQHFQTEGAAKVCNSNTLVVKEKGKKLNCGRTFCQLLLHRPLFRNLISQFVSPQKTWFNEVRASQQPGRSQELTTFVKLQCQPCYFAKEDNISLVWMKRDLALRRGVNENWVRLHAFSSLIHTHTHTHSAKS